MPECIEWKSKADRGEGPEAPESGEGAGAASGTGLLIGWKQILERIGNISTWTARRWVRTHGLPVSHVGRTPVSDPNVIEAWKEGIFFQGRCREERFHLDAE